MQKKYIVRLSRKERETLQEIVKRFKGSSQKVRRAQVLLKADASGAAWTDKRIALALAMPADGWKASATLVVIALSLLIPWNVVGTIWQIYGRADIGLLGAALQKLGIDYSYTGNARDAWLTVLVMDVWHWTPLVALLCFAGLRSIPDAYYQAARIDGASRLAVFRYIQLPKMRGVLMIAVLLRFMDSFMIYTEPFVLTGGGPGNATTFLSQYLTQKAVGQFDLGPAAALSPI